MYEGIKFTKKVSILAVDILFLLHTTLEDDLNLETKLSSTFSFLLASIHSCCMWKEIRKYVGRRSGFTYFYAKKGIPTTCTCNFWIPSTDMRVYIAKPFALAAFFHTIHQAKPLYHLTFDMIDYQLNDGVNKRYSQHM